MKTWRDLNEWTDLEIEEQLNEYANIPVEDWSLQDIFLQRDLAEVWDKRIAERKAQDQFYKEQDEKDLLDDLGVEELWDWSFESK